MMVPRALLLLLMVTIMMECVSAKRPKPPKPRRPCKYNKQKYPAGTVIDSLPDYCVELKCSVKGKRTELALIEGCTCCKPVTEPPTEPPTKLPTQPPKPTTVPPKPTTVPPKPATVPPKPTTVPPKPTTVPPKPTTVPPKPTTVPPKPTTLPPKPTNAPFNPVTEGSSDNDCDYSATFGSTHTMNLAPNDACPYHLNEVSASDIKIILETHNIFRARVASGSEGSQPSATNMFELKWNTEIAKVAQAWAEQCPNGHDSYGDRNICDQDYTYTGQNIYSYWGYSSASEWDTATFSWYHEVQYMTSSLVDSFGSSASGDPIGHYTQVVWADTYEIGCGIIHYPDMIGSTTYPESKKYVCNYGPNGNWLNQPVYESGTTASNCPHGPSANYPGLCAYPATQSHNPATEPPNPVSESPNPATESPNPGTESPNPVTEGSIGSDCDYSSTFGSTHTMNLATNNECVYHLNGVSASERDTILQTHNDLRAKVAKGLEDGAIDGSQPSATNMLELRWNTKLAEVAQAWAEQCPNGHDSYDDRKFCEQVYSHVGQNIYYSWGYSAESKWAHAIERWYSEVEYMTSSLIDSFGSSASGNAIGHYTQVVWADTYEVGCGAIHFPDLNGATTYPESKIYVCNYGPNGNWRNDPVYESGTTASNCPHGPSVTYTGLCAGPPASQSLSRKAIEIDPPKYMSAPLRDIPWQP